MVAVCGTVVRVFSRKVILAAGWRAGIAGLKYGAFQRGLKIVLVHGPKTLTLGEKNRRNEKGIRFRNRISSSWFWPNSGT